MELLIRLLRAQALLWTILLSYVGQFGLQRLFRRSVVDEESGRVKRFLPPWLKKRRRRVDEKNAKRLLNGMLSLHGVYIKLGQVLSLIGLLPKVYQRELAALQDAVPPRPFDEIATAITTSLGKSLEEAFLSINPKPVAAASLGQVHEARTHDGTKVAVKVLYPGIRDVIRVDMRVVRLAVRVYKWFVPVQNIEEVYTSLLDLLKRETDYLHEAECMRRVAHNFADDPMIVTPEVVDELSTTDVLTMTYIEGHKIADIDMLVERDGINRRKLAERLVRCFYKQTFIDRFLHADPHPGNFLLRVVQGEDGKPDAQLAVLDYGTVTEVKDSLIAGMVAVLRGYLEHRDELVVRGIESMGFVSDHADRALFERTVRSYFAKLLSFDARTPAALVGASRAEREALVDLEVSRGEMRRLMRSVKYPEGWFYIERSAVMLFWLVAQIDPNVDAAQVGMPYVLELLSADLQRNSRPPVPHSAKESAEEANVSTTQTTGEQQG